MMNELKNKLQELEVLEKIADEAEHEYELDCENEEKENAFDKAWNEEFNASEEAAQMVVDISGGQIDLKTARQMVKGKRADLFNILKQAV